MVIIGVFLTWIFGYSLISFFKLKKNFLLELSLSYLLGIGIQTLMMFYMAFSNVKLDLINVSTLMISSVLVLNILYFIFNKKVLLFEFYSSLVSWLRQSISIFKAINIVHKLLVSGIVVLCVFVFVAGIYWPVAGWDSIALYDFRARVFKESGYMWDAINRGYFFGYPLMTSMMNTWVYLLGFNFPRFMYSLIYICFAAVFYSFLRVSTSRLNSLIFTVMLMISPQIFGHSYFDYTNMPYTAYFFISTAFLFLFTTNKKYSYLILSALFMGVATWIRSTDPFWTVNIVVLLVWCLFNKKILPIILYLTIFLPIQQSWNMFLTQMSQTVSTQSIITSSVSIIFSKFDVTRLIQIVTFVLNVVGPSLYLYFLLAITTLVINIKNVYKFGYLNLILLGNVSLLFVGSYVFSFIWPGWSLIGESLGRMSLVFVPLFLYYVGIQNEKI